MIREGLSTDKTAINNLRPAAIGLLNSEVDMYFAYIYDYHNTVVNVKNNQVKASIQVNHFPLALNGKRISAAMMCGQMYDVKTGKEDIQILRNDVINQESYRSLITLVKTNEPDDYLEYGFYPVINHRLYTIFRENLPTNSYFGVSKSFQLKELAVVYNKFIANFDGYRFRDDAYYLRMIDQLPFIRYNLAVYHNEQGDAEGYIIYHIEDERIYADELIYLNGEALIRLLAYGLRLKKRIDVSVSEYEDLSMAMPGIGYQLQTYACARINDLELFERLFGQKIWNSEEGFQLSGKPLFFNEKY